MRKKKSPWLMWALMGGGLLLIAGGGKVAYDQYKQRGIRNNNPGNIRINNNIPWLGRVAQNTDGNFEQFSDPVYGLRALSKTLQTYMTKHHLVTVRQIIARWAPTNENNTGAYVEAVAKSMAVNPDAPLKLTNLPGLVAGIVQHENGVQPYPMTLINKAANMA